MALTTTNDLVKGEDFSVLTAATGAQHDQLVELAYPTSGTNGDGIGMCILTHDTALDTPVVPDPDSVPGTTEKWKRYTWIRIPHSTATSINPVYYAWNDDADVNATFLQWLQLGVDLAGLANETAGRIAADDALTANLALTDAKAVTADANATTAINSVNRSRNHALFSSVAGGSPINLAQGGNDIAITTEKYNPVVLNGVKLVTITTPEIKFNYTGIYKIRGTTIIDTASVGTTGHVITNIYFIRKSDSQHISDSSSYYYRKTDANQKSPIVMETLAIVSIAANVILRLAVDSPVGVITAAFPASTIYSTIEIEKLDPF